MKEEGKNKCAGYDVFREVFNSTGYKLKEPHIDTYKKCDEHAKHRQDSKNISTFHDSHIAEAEKAYESKKQDKLSAKDNPAERVIVFYLQTSSSCSVSFN
ncbi:hypothetical protein PR048_001313 [Dryococelus australis]|uniref:Uncharacterized protein n=1 Tax=Dryococelus australis TaxID=614101 RepID=A0ABQ9IHP1_9NEOP|nr:hypothetical protein PR048_001313 [Dryococelus australis]